MVIGEVRINKPGAGNLDTGWMWGKGWQSSVTRGPISWPSSFECPQSLTCAFLNGQTGDVLKIIIAPSLPPMQKCAVPFLSKAKELMLLTNNNPQIVGDMYVLFVLARAAQRCQVLESKCTLEKQFDLWEQEILNKFWPCQGRLRWIH